MKIGLKSDKILGFLGRSSEKFLSHLESS